MKKEDIMSKYEYYRKAMTGTGPKLAELTLEEAANDPQISRAQLAALAEYRKCWEGGA